MLNGYFRTSLALFERLVALTFFVLPVACGPEQKDVALETGQPPAPLVTDATGVAAPPAAEIADIEQRIRATEYRFRKAEAGFQAVNRRYQVDMRADARGMRVASRSDADNDELVLRLDAWGRGRRMTKADAVAPKLGACASDGSTDVDGACLERLELEQAGLTEWWENREEGVEQGFTIAERLPGTERLRIELRVEGVKVTILSGELDASFETESGLEVRYSGLRAEDADGKAVPARMVALHGGLALEVDDKGARYPLLVDPILTTASFTAESNQGLAAFGYSAAGAGDVNGDGFGDIVVGAWLYDNGQSDEGRAYLFLGSLNGLAATPAWTNEVNQDGASFGRTVASAGDVNGDGYSDVIVGAPGYSNGESQEGAVFLYLGSAAGLATMPAWTGEGGQADAQYGLAIGSAGDVNRDGRCDIVVGAPYFDNGQLDEGQVRVYLGTASGLATSAAFTTESDQVGAYYGTSVAGAGDVNRDGYGDIVVGAPYFDNGNTDEGRTYSYHGSAGGLVATVWSIEGGQDTAYVGNSIAGAGDVNGDGYSDVIVGASSFTNGQADEGRATIYYGSAMGLSATANWTFEGNQAGAELGASVASLGDENGDGYADVIVGAPGYDGGQTDEGRVYFFVGSASGPIPAVPQLVESDQSGAAFGRAVAAAGDVNGDGFADALIGAPNHDNGQTDEGRVTVLSGSGGGFQFASATFTTASAPAVGDAGDVNGDGYADVIVGLPTYAGSFVNEGRLALYPGSDAGLTVPTSWSPTGGLMNGGLGAFVVGAGDVNGDGYADIMAASPSYAADAGRAWVFYGSSSGPSAAADWIIDGAHAGARLGSTISNLGDVNGDGYSDVAVGSSSYTNGQMFEGRASVYLGSSSGLATSPAWSIEGNLANAALSNVTGLGDVNGDGLNDFAIGSSLTSVRSVYIYAGSATTLSTTPVQTISMPMQFGFGDVIVRAGDVNGDGYADAILGTPRTTYHGSSSWLTQTTWVPNVNGFVPGTSMVSGDFNGDGYSDVVLHGQLPGAAVWYAFPGTPAGLSPTQAGGGNVSTARMALADVNGDGFSDLIHEYMTGFRTIHGNTFENTSSAFAYAPQARRTGTTTPIAPYGIAQSGAFDARLIGRTAFGRGRVKIAVEVKPFGTPFDGAGLIVGSAWTDTSSAGVDLQQAVSGLAENGAYRWRARLKYDPSLGFPQGWSRWQYGGWLGHRRGVHLRASCVSGDTDGDGTPNCSDGCPNDPNKVAPGVCGCGMAETDSDGDGTPNCNDGCANDPSKVAPGACGCGMADTDTDGDGAANCVDGCPNNPGKTSPGVCGCTVLDTDSDGDGTPNCNDSCPNDPNKVMPGTCGCGVSDADSDGDGTPNCTDGCPNDPNKIAAGICGCGVSDADSDGDGTRNCNDGCPNDPNKITAGLCGCGVSDADTDSDGTPNCTDGCPSDSTKTVPGACGCGASDADSDGDGTPNCTDGCANDPQKTAPGNCGCGQPEVANCGDACPNDPNKTAPGVCGCGTPDTDSDSDGTPNCNDACPNDPGKTAAGVCGCGDADTDSDSDGTPNCNDSCPSDSGKTVPGVCGCGTADTDADTDGTPNCNDDCPNDRAKIAPGACGCGVADTDGDADATPDCDDDCPLDPNKTAPGACGCGALDTDGDGVDDCEDDCPSRVGGPVDGCPDGGGEGGAGGQGGEGSGGEAGSGGTAGGAGQTGTGGSGDAGAGNTSGEGGEAGAGVGGDAGRAGSSGSSGAGGVSGAAGSGGGAGSGGKPPKKGGADEDSGCGCRLVKGSSAQGDVGRALAFVLALGLFARRRAARRKAA